MKLNWGTSIAIFYGLFVLALIFAVYKSTQWGVPLVQEEYYQADIHYEKFRTKRENASQLMEKPKVQVFHNKAVLQLQLPRTHYPSTGEAHLYRPSQTGMDHRFPITLDTMGQMILPLQGIQKGRWKIQIDWTHSEKGYYWEEDVLI